MSANFKFHIYYLGGIFMIYTVKRGDTLLGIAQAFGTTVEALLEANVICNPKLIFVEQVLIIPSPGLELPKAGGGPYYTIMPGDTLACLAQQFNTSIKVLAEINEIPNTDLILTGMELLIGPDVPDPVQLKKSWEQAAEICDRLNSLQIHGIYYIGSFQWAALGRRAIPFLLNFLNSPCDVTRAYAVLSLGRIALNDAVRKRLTNALKDRAIASLAKLALHRIKLAEQGMERVHLLTRDAQLANEPLLDAPTVPLAYGTEVIVRRWNIPSPTGEDFPPGGLAIWDQIQVVETNQTGYLLRIGYQETVLM